MHSDGFYIIEEKDLPQEKTCLGFDKANEFYYRDRNLICFEIGSLLIALTTLPIYKLLESVRVNNWTSSGYIQSSKNDEQLLSIYNGFADAYCNAYLTLSSYHMLLGDQLIAPLMRDEICTVFNSVEPESSCDSSYIKIIENYIKQEVFSGEYEYSRFNPSGIKKLFANREIVLSEKFKKVFEHLNSKYLNVFEQLRILTFSFSLLIPKILERRESPPVHRFVNHFISGFFYDYDFISAAVEKIACTDSSSYDPLEVAKAMTDLKSNIKAPYYSINRLVCNDNEATYSETGGSRWVSFYNINNPLDAIYLEFEFMCTNNIELAKCKNCGRYFLPLTRASNFCDRLLADGSGRTCKTISSQWYAGARRGNDPINDMYILYKKRYLTRKMRNEAMNPQERFDKWKQQAKILIKECESGNISFEEFSKTLAEMDKDMKPLDKM